MTRSIFAAAALAASIAALPTVAHATAYTCKCDANFAPAVGSGALNKDGNNFTCDQTWTDNSTGHDTGGYNQYVKFSFPDAVVKGDSTNVKFAARNLPGQCMNYAGQYVYDSGGTAQRWAGGKCDDANLNVNGWTFDESHAEWSSSLVQTKITGEMRTTSAHNHFAAFYQVTQDHSKHLIAVCAD